MKRFINLIHEAEQTKLTKVFGSKDPKEVKKVAAALKKAGVKVRVGQSSTPSTSAGGMVIALDNFEVADEIIKKYQK